jgi:hypothetical protein
MFAVEGVQVGAANRTRVNPDYHFAGSGYRIGNRLETEVSPAAQYLRLHRPSFNYFTR